MPKLKPFGANTRIPSCCTPSTDPQRWRVATNFFMRVDVETVKQTLADLERMTLGDTIPEDFVDLAETTEFKPEIQEGECSA